MRINRINSYVNILNIRRKDPHVSCMSVFCFYYKDLGHFWLGYIRMLGYLLLTAHLAKVMCVSLTCYKGFLDIDSMTIEIVPHPFSESSALIFSAGLEFLNRAVHV